MRLSDDEREVFRDRGLLHLRRFVPGHAAKRARDAVLAELARLGARVSGKWHGAKFPKRLRHLPELDEVIPGAMLEDLSELAGRELVPAEVHPQLLLTAPQGVTWSVPSLGWHLDVASPSRDELPGIQVFVLIDDVAPRGGGTVAIAGSHRLHGSANAQHVLRGDPVFAQLFEPSARDRERFLAPHVVAGVQVQVVEMVGVAGDAYLMDMRTVHAPAPNAAKWPRIVLTSRYLRRAHAAD